MPLWTWNDEPVDGGRAVLCDIDGVLADADHRRHLVRGAKRWAEFFALAHADPPILGGLTVLDLLDDDLVVILVTSRPESIHDQTVAWLREYGVRWDLLVMRSRRDHGPAPDIKELAVAELRDAGFDPVLAIDDDERVVRMYLSHDIPSVHIRSDL